jgi:hypothetical protein
MDPNISQSIIIIVLIIALYFQYNKINSLINQKQNAESKSNQNEEQVKREREETIAKQQLDDEITHRQKLKERDYKVVYDPLTPGEKRLPAHQMPRGIFKDRINVPTRGQPDNYQYLGNLVRETDEKIIPVFGRQDYPGSDYYEYYMMINQDGNFGIKIPLNNGDKRREIEEEEIVKIDYFNETKGDFIYKPFDYDVPRYNPYDF